MKPPPQTGCNTTSSSGVTPPVTTTGPAPAFQICVDPAQCGDLCFRLGDTAANAQLSSFPWNPAHVRAERGGARAGRERMRAWRRFCSSLHP